MELIQALPEGRDLKTSGYVQEARHKGRMFMIPFI